MKELLEKWFHLEPELCRESSNQVPGWYYVKRDNCWKTVNTNTPKIFESEIQGATQQAIEAKGWDYEQRWVGKEKVAYVYPPGIKKLIRHDCSTHAEALLKVISSRLNYLQLITFAHFSSTKVSTQLSCIF